MELTAHMIAVNNRRDSVSPPPLVAKLKKGKSQTVALTLPKSQGPEASGALSKKRKKILRPKDHPLKPRNHHPSQRRVLMIPTQAARAPDTNSTAPNEGTAKTTPRPEGSLRDKDLGGNIPPANMESIYTPIVDPSGTGKTSSEVEPDTEPLKLQTYADIQAFLLSDDELDKDSDEEEVLAAGNDMDEDPQDDKEVITPSPKQDQPEPSHV
ncbi:hypothetical protein Tco_0270453 [Tanacetum coccineum]